jgi:hypothetical protein
MPPSEELFSAQSVTLWNGEAGEMPWPSPNARDSPMPDMTVTISRLYNSYPEAQAAINRLEAAGVKHGDISVLASNADGWYKENGRGKSDAFPDRDLDGKDDRAEGARTGAGIGAATGGALGGRFGVGTQNNDAATSLTFSRAWRGVLLLSPAP